MTDSSNNSEKNKGLEQDLIQELKSSNENLIKEFKASNENLIKEFTASNDSMKILLQEMKKLNEKSDRPSSLLFPLFLSFF